MNRLMDKQIEKYENLLMAKAKHIRTKPQIIRNVKKKVLRVKIAAYKNRYKNKVKPIWNLPFNINLYPRQVGKVTGIVGGCDWSQLETLELPHNPINVN